ncbi:MAG: prepilin-type N-terminal cleavage/methylation domain-containing protein [Planctomycetota bacterium]
MRRLKEGRFIPFLTSHFSLLASRSAFSLVEMMIAIVILGLGLVMVATIFPVAWDRARTLSDYTVEQAASSGAHATLSALLRPAGHSLVKVCPPPPTPCFEESQLTTGSLAGDMFFDPTLVGPASPRLDWYKAILAYSDTSVHALNVENILFLSTVQVVATVPENPWDLEDPGGSFPTPPVTQIVQGRFLKTDYPHPVNQRNRGEAFPDRLFYTPQVRVWERLYPPIAAPPAVPGQELDQWNEKLATRRFCWAVLHRLRTRVGPAPLAFDPSVLPGESDRLVREAAAAMGSTRTFDMYYVTLRRSKSTNRYARQDPTPARIPNPFSFVRPVQAVEPAAMESKNDVMFPVGWRVQVQLPRSLAYRSAPPDSAKVPTGVPTEIHVPPDGVTGSLAGGLASMFPSGTTFVDEIEGHVYRVAKRRILLDQNGNESAILTLDREILQEDIEIPAGDSRCESCTKTDWTKDPDPEELLRTVWVFPPAVDRSQPGGEQTPTFDGPSPVVNIEVATLSISPS